MKTTILKNENLLTILSLNNLIVPEIQREYVWGLDVNHNVLKRFLNNVRDNGKSCPDCHYVHTEKDLNVGFLYTYKPSFVTLENDKYLDEFIIDGQQRLTTLFILLLYLSIKENRKKDFLSIIRFDEEIEEAAFDYKVRNLTHYFLNDLLQYCFNHSISIEDIIPIRSQSKSRYLLSQTWFLADYAEDCTIQGLLGALHTVATVFNSNDLYFDYVLSRVRFWHFKTEFTSQGEDLYITMNSRGERLSSSEERKILPSDKMTIWGKKWEEWQDYFWLNRGENQSADNGFDSFLFCSNALCNYLQKDAHHGYSTELLNSNTQIEKIEEHYFSLVRLSKYRTKYNFPWLEQCFKEIMSMLNKNDTNWNVDYTDDNKATERNKMVLLWFVLELLKGTEERELSIREVRSLHFIWLRYNNFDRSVTSVKQWVKLWNSGDLTNFPWNEEEKSVYSYLNGFDDGEITDVEQKIWEIEMHPLNLDASDVGATHISHLINLDGKPSLQELDTIHTNLLCLFDNEKFKTKYEKPLKSLLLHYENDAKEPFWFRKSPWYYHNCDCSTWKRIIRWPKFKELFAELFDENHKCVVDDVLRSKSSIFFSQFTCIEEIANYEFSLREQLILYSSFIEDLWQFGNLAFVTEVPDEERLFRSERIVYSIKNNFYGNSQRLRDFESNSDMKKQAVYKVLTDRLNSSKFR